MTSFAPLAARLRPQSLDDFIGQKHLVGEGKPLHQMLQTGQPYSLILWGPPGVGKTSLAQIIAGQTDRDFHHLSAVSAGKADLQKIIKPLTDLQTSLSNAVYPPIVFLDEIHRFNKAQQDYLLPFVENGTIILIGATTENPSFEVNTALLSRTQVFVLQPLSAEELATLAKKGAKELDTKLSLKKDQLQALIKLSGGDGRLLLNLLEQAYQLDPALKLQSLETIAAQPLSYDKTGEQHYNLISAFIKSMRAGSPDAALYYLARMIAGGEDPKFIARRMIIFASEDIGLAQPTALVVANAAFSAVEKIGLPEAQINLAHATAYLAESRKSRGAYDAYFAALDDAKKHGNLPIPLHLRNAPTKLMKDLGYGKGYEMYPDPKESFLPEKLKGKRYLKN